MSAADRARPHVTRVELTDPMSGFFMMRRDRFDPLARSLSTQRLQDPARHRAHGEGDLRIVEEPYVFGSRIYGESQARRAGGLDFLGLLLAKLTGGVVTPRFLSFALVGTHRPARSSRGAEAVALGVPSRSRSRRPRRPFVAMTGNFLLNNQLTYPRPAAHRLCHA